MEHVNVQMLLLVKQPLFHGQLYTVVDNSTIQGEVDNGNVNLCTTLVTNMSSTFSDKLNFQICFWDTSRVINMQGNVFILPNLLTKILELGCFKCNRHE